MVHHNKHELVLACGDPRRGDDGVALLVAKALVTGICDSETEVDSKPQWLPEMAKTISEANLVVFVNPSTEIPAGAISTRPVAPCPDSEPASAHWMNPERLLALARENYGAAPEEAFQVSIGVSFEPSNQLSESVRHAVPLALNQVKAILSGISIPSASSGV